MYAHNSEMRYIEMKIPFKITIFIFTWEKNYRYLFLSRQNKEEQLVLF